MWITLAAMHHHFRDQMYLQTVDICSRWLPHFFSHHMPFTQMLSNQYIFPTKFFRHIMNTATIRVLQKFYHHYHGDCRILANGMRIFNLECHYCFTTILGRRPQSNYPWQSLRMHLHHLLLDTHQPHATPTMWRCLIWMFCYCTKCSFYTTVIISRWRLQKWFWYCWFTNSFTENSSHTPCFQHRTCILQPSAHYTLQYSYYNTSHFTANSYQTSALPLILQLRYWSYPRQHPSMFR